MPNFQNLSGQRFGKLTVVAQSENKGIRTAWVCLCDCGNIKNIKSNSLKTGHTRSCGCVHDELAGKRLKKYRNNVPTPIVHGHARKRNSTKTYRTWMAMRARCSNPNTHSYKYYGGRGISVCDEWVDSFENFVNDMGEAPENLSIDRIDNYKGYSKENCRWATVLEQAQNRRNNKKNKTHYKLTSLH